MITLSIPIPFLQHRVKIYIQRNKHVSGPPCEPSDTPGLSAWCLESERAFSWQIPTPDVLLQYFDDPLHKCEFILVDLPLAVPLAFLQSMMAPDTVPLQKRKGLAYLHLDDWAPGWTPACRMQGKHFIQHGTAFQLKHFKMLSTAIHIQTLNSV